MACDRWQFVEWCRIQCRLRALSTCPRIPDAATTEVPNSVSPSGVEHPGGPRGRACRPLSVPNSVSPSGVEHGSAAGVRGGAGNVPNSVSPSGVEHVQTGSLGTFNSGAEFSVAFGR